MTPRELKHLAIRRFGRLAWKEKLIAETGINRFVIEQWLTGQLSMPPRVVVIINKVCGGENG